ncbi:MAG: hypothetical protein RJA48_1043, partial [Verrucomicrobiota bacterium]
MFPDVEGEDRGAVHVGDALHEGAVLVRRGGYGEGLVGLDDEPGPTGTEAGGRSGLEGSLEALLAFETAESLLDGFAEGADGFAATVRGDDVPEEGVVGVAAGVVADRGADGLRDLGEVGDEFVDVGRSGEAGFLGEGGVHVRDVSVVVLAVVDLHGRLVDV